LAIGAAWCLANDVADAAPVSQDRRAAERESALNALSRVAEELSTMAARLAPAEAEIVETGALMARDPALLGGVVEATMTSGLTAPAAILQATAQHADAIAALGDEMLAARADDVRSLGRRAARLCAGAAVAPPGRDLVLIADDLGPADVAEYAPNLAAIALAGGGATAHAAIVARSLGLPMVTGLGAEVLTVADGTRVAVDGRRGTAVLAPAPEYARSAATAMSDRRRDAIRAQACAHDPAVSTDGVRVTVLANVATPAELTLALGAGAEGIGLLRTELAFLEAADWPGERDHASQLEPILTGLGARPAVIRVLDFGADKAPPFLHGVAARGLELLLDHPHAFTAQLRAILRGGAGYDVRILLPLVDTPEQLAATRELAGQLAAELGLRLPPVGAMIETRAGTANARAIAAGADFLSIGTNDLTAAILGTDRFAAGAGQAHHPRVLQAIAQAVTAAHEAGRRIEVCGEAASEPTMVPLLIGLGVDELSVGAARVAEDREWIRQLDAGEAAGLARSALTMDTADEVEWAVGTLGGFAAATLR
jgi:phosphoenolpyruvate-protein kinase (PTS system EI component)